MVLLVVLQSSTYTSSVGGHFYVVGQTSEGCSVTSDEISLNMINLSAVSEFDVTNTTATTASLDWDNASPTNVYDISISSDGGLTWTDFDSYVGSAVTFTNLASSTTYEIEITSTAYGCESEVFSSSFTTGVDCIVPENISLTATPFEVTLSWDALDGADSYFLVYKLPGTGWQTTTVTDNFFTLSHDGNGLAYFYVRSVCGDDDISAYSSLYSIELPSCPSISLEASATAFCFGESSTLTASSGFDSYQWYNDDGAISGATSSTYTSSVGGHFYVVGQTTEGCSVTSDEISLNMINLSAVSEFEVTNTTATTASLDWDNASPTNVYDISISSDGGLTWTDFDSYVGSAVTFTNLASSTTYEIEITSTAYGCESEVFSSSFTTGVDCIVPENISLTATPFEVTLSWDALDGADSYFLVYKLPGTGWQTATVTDNFFTLSHDGNGLAYFYVRSICGDDDISAYSSLYSIELPSCPSISLEASATAFCFGESSTLTASSGFDSYQWYNDDGAISGATEFDLYIFCWRSFLCCRSNFRGLFCNI